MNDDTRQALHDAAARSMDPVDVQALVTCAVTALQSSAFQSALEILEGVTVLEPDHAQAWGLTAMAHEKLGRDDEARLAYERAVALDETDLVHALALVEVYLRQSDLGRARALVSWLITEVADDAPDIRDRARAIHSTLAAEVTR